MIDGWAGEYLGLDRGGRMGGWRLLVGDGVMRMVRGWDGCALLFLFPFNVASFFSLTSFPILCSCVAVDAMRFRWW